MAAQKPTQEPPLDDAEETHLQDEEGVLAGDDENLSHALMEEEEDTSIKHHGHDCNGKL